MTETVQTRESLRAPGALRDWFTNGLRDKLLARGYPVVEGDQPAERGGIALHPIDIDSPKSFRRRNRAVFVVGIGEAEHAPEVPLATLYPLQLRSLGNIFILVVRSGHGGYQEAFVSTLEQGSYSFRYNGDDDAFFERVVERLAPLATSNLIIENEFVSDLEPELWDGDEVTASITRAGKRLDELDLLPSPFPIDDYLPEGDLRHLKQMFNIGGLSYGNVSARKDDKRFWMSASGVDKSSLEEVGTEILMVTDFISERKAMRLSVPPHVNPRRVSVDAIEHFMIYREHPSVGAILHIHAWMPDIVSTHVNYPCGTIELATAVADLVRQAPDPGHAVIGLRNHGLTITGESLDEIFDRIEDQVIRQVPMV
jgi:ribulose-5-phosphate 4-epimerase/fuculose-1-phosphate aldolase